ncbi:ABC transporter ATP-binding protein [Eubacterium oxidoreducens]|uniref:ABC-type quaternary amine transporter n=1 Tax=Eubacterium oxidoreducens TaxID=1732 RepID=A0A1G6C235_EUBOX|nr:ABC transporter ATP-binding protein [Eubacterium oxidoreducens]SDB26931.1 sulfonate transport system ATP-binding protein [Eubacterium oxidoreducens]
MKNAILEVENVERIYKDEDKETLALKNVNFKIEEGEFVSIIGASGCGKTTLLRMIAGLDQIEKGNIRLRGEAVGKNNQQIGYVFQQGSLFEWLTVEQNIAYGLKASGQYKQKNQLVKEYITLTGLTGFEDVYPHQISGGMAQRVAIARALVNSPDILLLDEPMGALDSFTRANLQDKLLEIKHKNKITMLLVTHDIDEAIYLSDKIIIMTPRPGKISEIMNIKIAHPRNRSGSEFVTIRNKLMEKFALASEDALPEYVI